MAQRLPYPDGLDEGHTRAPPTRGALVSVIVLSALLTAALLGIFGGGHVRPMSVVTEQARLTVATPRVLRSGLFFETRIAVEARADFADLTIAISPSLWRDMTINTMVPAAREEMFADGMFRFHYGAARSGDRVDVKVDGQINPPLFAGTSGHVAVYDGQRRIASLPVSITVLP